MSTERERTVLWKNGIRVGTWQDAEFVLFVPGIRENHPRLEVGDLVQLREVLEQEKSGSHRAFEGRVISVRKREGFIRAYTHPLLCQSA